MPSRQSTTPSMDSRAEIRWEGTGDVGVDAAGSRPSAASASAMGIWERRPAEPDSASSPSGTRSSRPSIASRSPLRLAESARASMACSVSPGSRRFSLSRATPLSDTSTGRRSSAGSKATACDASSSLSLTTSSASRRVRAVILSSPWNSAPGSQAKTAESAVSRKAGCSTSRPLISSRSQREPRSSFQVGRLARRAFAVRIVGEEARNCGRERRQQEYQCQSRDQGQARNLGHVRTHTLFWGLRS